MIQYRPFRNDDPPQLAEVWRNQAPLRALMQPMSAGLLEHCVLAQPFFDPEGLIVAVENGRAVGFVHAGFAAAGADGRLANEDGILCMLMVAPHPKRESIAGQLLERAETYLRQNGAKRFQSGSYLAAPPFYLGLYGGSLPSGVLQTDELSMRLLQGAGYQPWRQCQIVQRSLSGFRPSADRSQMQVRRRYQVEHGLAAVPSDWYQACVWAKTELAEFRAVPRGGGTPCARLTLWDMEPLASSWGIRAMGIVHIEVDMPHRRQGLARYLLGEVLRQLQSEDVKLVEAQVESGDTVVRSLLDRLGFLPVEQATVLQKTA